jgi:hypothetical protein
MTPPKSAPDGMPCAPVALHVFAGSGYRVQWRVWETAPMLKTTPRKHFHVLRVLDDAMPKNTPYDPCGFLLYDGPDFEEAWRALIRYVPTSLRPACLEPFDAADYSRPVAIERDGERPLNPQTEEPLP